MHIEKLLTITDAAELAGVSRASIYYWMKIGALAYIQKGTQRLVLPDALLFADKKASETGKSRRKQKKT